MPKPTLLCYDPVPSPWAPKLKQLCAIQGLRLRAVDADSLVCPVGALAQGLAPSEVPEALGAEGSALPAAVPEPMLVFCYLTGPQLDRCLAALRKIGVPRTVLKAVLTPDNSLWTFAALYEELCKERESLS